MTTIDVVLVTIAVIFGLNVLVLLGLFVQYYRVHLRPKKRRMPKNG